MSIKQITGGSMSNGNDEALTYTVSEVAMLTKVSVKTIYQKAKEGIVPCIRIGRRVLIPKLPFHAWFNSSIRKSD
jgi:excisionase family DNA binding protein